MAQLASRLRRKSSGECRARAERPESVRYNATKSVSHPADSAHTQAVNAENVCMCCR